MLIRRNFIESIFEKKKVKRKEAQQIYFELRMSNIEIKYRTKFILERRIFSFILVICNRDLNNLYYTFPTMSLYEE